MLHGDDDSMAVLQRPCLIKLMLLRGNVRKLVCWLPAMMDGGWMVDLFLELEF